jgi:benzoyl-CoA-dihydrodiol lyase
MVRRDLADFFSTLVEGVKGKRAVEWRFVDATYSTSRFKAAVREHAEKLAAQSDRPSGATGIALNPLAAKVSDTGVEYSTVSLAIDRARRVATITVRAPEGELESTPDAIHAAGDQFWPLRAYRELDDAILRLRQNDPEVGVVVLKATGEASKVLEADRILLEHKDFWLVREIIHFMKRTLKRVDLTARSLFAIIEPGNAFAGSLFELALAADRQYMLDDPDNPNSIQLSPMNAGPLPMSNGLTRLQVRFLHDAKLAEAALALDGEVDAQTAIDAGLVTFAPDELDWDDEVRLAIEGRAAFSPDALTGMEANLRFAGPETMETKIFGRLSAWQNWIFIRPNAVGPKGALTTYGSNERAEFDYTRT